MSTLIDYTPDDPSIDQEKLTNSMNVSGLVQASNEVAIGMLRCFCTVTAQDYTAHFIEEVINASDCDGVIPAVYAIVRDIITCLRDCNEIVFDSPAILPEPSLSLITSLTRQKAGIEENEMMSYIEKAISTRLRILPIELKPTVREVIGSIIKLFAKEVTEEIRANIYYDYQFQNIVVNLAFLNTMIGMIYKDDQDVLALLQEIVYSAYDRCYEPSSIHDSLQQEFIEKGIEGYKDFITVEEF